MVASWAAPISRCSSRVRASRAISGSVSAAACTTANIGQTRGAASAISSASRSSTSRAVAPACTWRICGRSASGTGSASPTSVVSVASLSRLTLELNPANTVGADTPAAAAIWAIEVPA